MSLKPTYKNPQTNSDVVPRGLQFRGTSAGSCYINKGEIAHGGMARILRAFKYDGDHEVGTDFALKIPKVNSSDLVDPLEREAHFLSKIGGKGAVRLVERVIADPDSSDFGSIPGFVMPLLDGSDAASIFERHYGSTNIALNILRLALLCYEQIHAAGVVHLDAKPENLFVSTDHRSVTVLDFGISRFSGSPLDVLIGTPAFMAPELIRAPSSPISVEPTSDLYSLAVIAFVAIANKFPYGSFSSDIPLNALFPMILFNPLDPLSSAVSFRVPSGLDDVFSIALERDPTNRFQSAAAFRLALESVLKVDPTLGFTFALDY